MIPPPASCPVSPSRAAAISRLAAACLAIFLSAPASLSAQEEGGGGKGSSLGDLLSRVKDIKVPDSVANLPAQLTELKDAYLETAKTVEELRAEVAALREEMEAVKAENAGLREAVGGRAAAAEASDLLKPLEVSAAVLAAAYRSDRESADRSYLRRYLRVVGTIESFESGGQEIIVRLSADSETRVRCHIKRDASFHADVVPAQGRVISRNDRSTLLAEGQPVALLGTCAGMDLDVKLINCRVEGLDARRAD